MTIPRDDIERRFTYHAPADDATVSAHQQVRQECKVTADLINAVVPDGREKATALTKLEEAMMWANAGIARNGGPA